MASSFLPLRLAFEHHNHSPWHRRAFVVYGSGMTDSEQQDWARGRIVAVTGATSGFGEAIARRFHTAGASIVATGRRAERLQQLAADLGGRIHTRVPAVRDQAAVQARVDGLPPAFAAIDLLINNAGLAAG